MESLPLPGSGRTAERFRALWEGRRADVSRGRLALLCPLEGSLILPSSLQRV